MYLVDFTAAHFYNTALAGEGLEELLGRPLTQVESLYNPRHANTASAAVLRDDVPTLPADEACAIIYAAMQVNFPDSLVNTPLASNKFGHRRETSGACNGTSALMILLPLTSTLS